MLKRILLCLFTLTAPVWATAQEPANQAELPRSETAEQAPGEAAKNVSAEAIPPDEAARHASAEAAPPTAQGEEGPRTLSGMSILGNEEAPKALVIVPWKTSELGVSLSLSDTLDDRARPVDREVFLRELDYYALRSGE